MVKKVEFRVMKPRRYAFMIEAGVDPLQLVQDVMRESFQWSSDGNGSLNDRGRNFMT